MPFIYRLLLYLFLSLTTACVISFFNHDSRFFCKGFILHLYFLYLFYAYWCLTRFPYQMIFVSLNSNTTGVTSGAGITNPSGAPQFCVEFVLLDFCFLCSVCVLLFVFFFFWSLYCLSFNLRLLISPLVSASFS